MDAETFKKAFLPYHQKLYRTAYRIVKDAAGAEDIVQDTFMKLWSKRNDMQAVDNTEAFAIIILRNTCLDYLRKTKNDNHSDYDTDIPETVLLSKQIELQSDANIVKQLIDKLPEQQREILMMKHWEGYSDEEIEQITGLSPGNIRVILSRARKTIREQFIKYE
ncbi:RNA polymerase sigma-70 factor (ECF subfamily) [Dysgonomonas sp. PFB1-18]|uniref:RNA polymerase sigma factor n=1 Tax=unclassified Dysgonomonas TaxID=2630389 RepID=UPI0024753748|nr:MULTISPECIES: RNA polymerase sigma factor [unclassified Dysgonomonas]MDH6307679.1 RNA polymerase sigma-70 factor (ECF subfamily) [Dysgonomonas sp. PF1-14]MDH6337597.1 RNA polymerase sigma-70 factor (ECF subfamily) [Dysgonomonas sp. PF1-16]MDH6378821.1 RNA polymerase sigma-70 factor (ECF subfamily) [Dysgonomonas sp. PFB1-18]MDH6396456.1 RNA polymerase sigma-70 factor (ECF subfamily) [Dysgonomonas sp. PF1-23]